MDDKITELVNDINRLKENIDNCESIIVREECNIGVFKEALQKKRNELRNLK